MGKSERKVRRPLWKYQEDDVGVASQGWWFGNQDGCGVEVRVQRKQLVTGLGVTTEMLNQMAIEPKAR